LRKLIEIKPDRLYPGHNAFLLKDAVLHLEQLEVKMNSPWTTIITKE
jgi:hypothetical protein